MKRRSLETCSPCGKSKRHKPADDTETVNMAESPIKRCPLRPLSVRAIDDLQAGGVAHPFQRGIHVGLSPAIKYADRRSSAGIRKLETSDLQDSAEVSLEITRKSQRRSKMLVDKFRMEEDSKSHMDKENSLKNRKRGNTLKSKDAAENTSVTSTSSESSITSGGSSQNDDAEMKAAKTASAKRRVLLQRRSRFRMSKVRLVAQARQSVGKKSDDSEMENNGDIFEPDGQQETATASPSRIMSRRVRLQGSSTSEEEWRMTPRRGVRHSPKSEQTSKSIVETSPTDGLKTEDIVKSMSTPAKMRRVKKSPAKKSPAKKSPAKKSPAKIKYSAAKKSPAKKSTATKSPAKQSTATKSPTNKESIGFRSVAKCSTPADMDSPGSPQMVSIIEVTGSGLASSMKRGFDEGTPGFILEKCIERKSPKIPESEHCAADTITGSDINILSQSVNRESVGDTNSVMLFSINRASIVGLDSVDSGQSCVGDPNAIEDLTDITDKSFSSEMLVNVGMEGCADQINEGDDSHVEDNLTSDKSLNLGSDAAISGQPSPGTDTKTMDNGYQSNPEVEPNMLEKLEKTHSSEVKESDSALSLKPSKDDARMQRTAVSSDKQSLVKTSFCADPDIGSTSSTPPSNQQVDVCGNNTPKVKDILKAFRSEPRHAAKPETAKPPEKLRRQSLEGAPSMKEMMQRFHDSVSHGSIGEISFEKMFNINRGSLSSVGSALSDITDANVIEDVRNPVPADKRFRSLMTLGVGMTGNTDQSNKGNDSDKEGNNKSDKSLNLGCHSAISGQQSTGIDIQTPSNHYRKYVKVEPKIVSSLTETHLSELNDADSALSLTPSKGNAMKKRIVVSSDEQSPLRTSVRADLDVDSTSTTPLMTRLVDVDGNHNLKVKDILKAFHSEPRPAVNSQSPRSPVKARRQSLENMPSMKVMMQRFYDSVKASIGEEASPNIRERAADDSFQSRSDPEVAKDIVKTPTATSTPLPTTPSRTSMMKGALHHPGKARLTGSKVSFSPIIMTRTISAKLFDINPDDSVSSQSVSGESIGDNSFEAMVHINKSFVKDEEYTMEDTIDRCHTQPIEGGWADGSQSSSLEGQHGVHQRHHTQPITSQEKEEAESGKVKDGIASRLELTEDELALLQRSGEEDWKRRVLKKENTVDCGEVVKMREKKGDKKERPTSIADRLSLLQGSQDSWRDRIEETDVKQFTVAGKLELQGKAMTPDSPLLTRRRKPKVPLARDSESSEGGSTPSSPTKSSPHPTTPKGLPDTVRDKVMDEMREALSTPTMYMELGSDDDAKKDADEGPITVDVPHAAEGVDEFFQSRTVEELSKDKHDVSVDDFDHIFLASQDILPSVQKARPQTRRAASSRNPLKTLAQRRDIQTQYIQVQSGVADREMRRIKRDQIAGSACFATEALAGLAATENFANVMLRKTDLFTSGTPGNQKLEPYSEVMLLQVKGRRHCQTRLVAPDASSLNSGDCFILVTPERCWVWVGDFSNVIEKAKAVEVAGVIQAKRDLGCKSPYEPTVMEESAATIVKRFWEVLGGEADYQDVGPAEEDEVYEADMAETVRVYRLAGEQFVLWEEVSGCVPRYEMLNTKDILIFDFGSEFYLWTGKQAAFSKRKVALKLARDMWATGYDYTSHGFNPMSPLASESQGGLPLKDAERPDWTLFGKVNQNMETVLFREKFFDWPDASRLITVKGQDDVEPKTDGNIELMAYDVAKMIPIDTSPVTMVLEGSHVGRGNVWTELYEGLRREYEITTLATKVWHVNEYQVMDLDDVSYGQFHDGDTYVVRWQYMIMQTGMKTLKGASARHSLVGRERCAYFFWQGRHSSVNEKGASALMTVELDEERGPQVRVLQDKEQPCFLNLFKSKMVVHIGKREAEDTCTQGSWRLYVIRNELSGEAHLTEVTCSLTSFRSRGVFVLIHITTGQILLWNGAKSGNNTRQRALEIAQNLKTACPAEMGIKEGTKLVMTKMDEGYETQEFWEAMEFQDASAYVSLLDDVRPWTHTPRLFLMSSVSGEFRATEVVNPCRSGETVAPFPFLQADLYTAPQPAQLMIDNHHEVFLWQGWWPEGTEEEENISTGSAVARFNTDRCCAMETVLNYCQAKTSGSPSPAFVVYAGLEPKAFTNLFPYWEQNEEAAVANSKEGKKAGLRIPVKDVLKKLTSTRYTYDELQERPLPDGVDPMRIEAYLLDDEFQRVLGMTKEEFYERPTWKQSDMKKEFSLF